MAKYGNRKTTIDGIKFDSRKEARRYAELSLLERAGIIQKLRRQVKYELIPAQYEEFERYSAKTGKRLKNGRRVVEKACTYSADFVYEKWDGYAWQTVVEDTKGFRTEAYKIKKKLLLYMHGIKVTEV